MKALVIVALLSIASTASHASEQLAKSKNCMACHTVDKKLVGPSFKDIAKRYPSTEAAKVAASIIKGGSGAWGPIPMPANPQVSEKEALELVNWINSLK